MTTPPQDPFGTPREGEGQPSGGGQPFGSWPAHGSYGEQPQPGPSYGEPQPGPSYGEPQRGPSYGQPQPGQSYGQPGQSYGQPPAYGYGGAPQAWQGPTQTETKAIIALVCAIAAWVVLPLLPAIAALMVGRTARAEIAQSGGRLTGDGLVTAAKVIAWANIVLSVLGVLLLVLGLGLFAVSASDVQIS